MRLMPEMFHVEHRQAPRGQGSVEILGLGCRTARLGRAEGGEIQVVTTARRVPGPAWRQWAAPDPIVPGEREEARRRSDLRQIATA